MGGFSVECGFNGVREWVWSGVSRKGSPSVPGSSMVNLMSESMELKCS